MLAERMTESEQTEYENRKQQIHQGIENWVRVSADLLAIRDKRLYREQYKTFEECCRDEFNIGKEYAYRLIEAAQVMGELESPGTETEKCRAQTIVNKESAPKCTMYTPPADQKPAPPNVSQARALAKAPPGERKQKWKEAQETAPKDKTGKPKVTAAHVRRVVEQEAAPKPTNGEASAPVPEWQAVATDVDGLISELRAFSRNMRRAFKVEGQTITRAAADRYTWSGTIGAVNELVRYLEEGKPVGQDRGGIVTASDEKKRLSIAAGRKSA